jgi:hypothetical protein
MSSYYRDKKEVYGEVSLCRFRAPLQMMQLQLLQKTDFEIQIQFEKIKMIQIGMAGKIEFSTSWFY